MKYSPYEQIPDEDPFPQKEPPRGPALWKWVLAVGFGLFFVYRSTLPVLRLQSTPPPEFIGKSPKGRRDLREPQKRIAKAYWNVAVHSIQTRYSAKKSLPATPPPEFRIDSRLAPTPEDMDMDRAFYWQRLRDLWEEGGAWRVSYGWNTEWFTDLLEELGQDANQSLQQFVQGVRNWCAELGQIHIF